MPLSLEAAGLGLLAALFHASWNALVKTGGDRLALLTMATGFATVICFTLIPIVALPGPASWIYLGVSIVLHTGSSFFLIAAYRVGGLSHV